MNFCSKASSGVSHCDIFLSSRVKAFGFVLDQLDRIPLFHEDVNSDQHISKADGGFVENDFLFLKCPFGPGYLECFLNCFSLQYYCSFPPGDFGLIGI